MEPALIIACIAILVSAVSANYTRRQYRIAADRERRDRTPRLACHYIPWHGYGPREDDLLMVTLLSSETLTGLDVEVVGDHCLIGDPPARKATWDKPLTPGNDASWVLYPDEDARPTVINVVVTARAGKTEWPGILLGAKVPPDPRIY